MKKMLLVLFAAGAMMLSAANTKPVVCLVMDADSALIAGAVMTSSSIKDTLRSGCDGRILLTPHKNRTRVRVEAEGYDAGNFVIRRWDAGKTLVLLLKAQPMEKNTHGPLLGRTMRPVGKSGEEILYCMDSKSVSARDEAEYEMAKHVDAYADYEPESNGPAAGKLTAGEVNDFAKWDLWHDILNGSHKEYVSRWGLRAAWRYAVQVTNKSGYPLPGVTVRLTKPDGEPLFTAVTDNTGKAELWDGLTMLGSRLADNEEPLLEVEDVKIPAKNNRLNYIELDRPCEAPATADVFFVFDATGSMGDELRYLQAEMKDVIARSQTAVEGLNIRTGALVYRDYSDNYLTRIARLSDDISKTQAFIDKQEAGGGGDYEEAVPEALLASLHVAGWSQEARARIAFLILDAPCHSDSATLLRLHEAVTEAALLGVRVVPVVCSGVDKDGELLMRSIALATNGTSFFLTDDSGIGNTHLKPTTDSLKVEHLNDMLVRTIIEFTRMPACDLTSWQEEAQADDPVEQFLPNPTDDETRPDAPIWRPEQVMSVRPNPCHNECYVVLNRDVEQLSLCDLSGKTIFNFGRIDRRLSPMALVPMQGLATGVYFVKAYCDGRWYTEKIIKIP